MNKKPIKIGIFSSAKLEVGGGLEKYIIDSAVNLNIDPYITAEIITMGDSFSRKIEKLLSLYSLTRIHREDYLREKTNDIDARLNGVNYLRMNSIKELLKQLQKYDVLYVKNELIEAFILKILLKYDCLPPVVFICATAITQPYSPGIRSRFRNRLYHGYVYKYLASGVKVFHVKNDLDWQIYSQMFPSAKVFKIHNALRPVASSLVLPTEMIFDRASFNICWVGRLTKQKGIFELINIIQNLDMYSTNRKVVWHIAGDGELSDDLSNLGLKKTEIILHGHIPNQFIPSFLEQGSLFVSTSKWETFGINIQEAQAAGLPALSFDIPGPREIILNDETGLLLNSEAEFIDAIIKILNGSLAFDGIREKTKERFARSSIRNELITMFRYAEKA